MEGSLNPTKVEGCLIIFDSIEKDCHVYSDAYLSLFWVPRALCKNNEICDSSRSLWQRSIKWYFHAMSETPLSYLTRTMMQEDKIWGSEVEIFAISAILEIDIYVAVECDNCKESSYNIHQQRIIRWYRYNASNNYDKSFAIYIANFNNHYEPVTTLINSGYPTYAENYQKVVSIE